ncbi:MAG: coproporphyrinogen III oxidase [Planctomyces sp.]|nr:coproporphyrinogen III oxidase [Planctomyces sp.]
MDPSRTPTWPIVIPAATPAAAPAAPPAPPAPAAPAAAGGPSIALPVRAEPGGVSARAVFAHPIAPPEALYIHTPFCAHKCHYCDFYSFVDTRDQQPAFVERLARELRALAEHTRAGVSLGGGPRAGGRVPLGSVFVGGGTPSLLAPRLWERLLVAIHEHFDLTAPGGVPAEFTVECNPESATPELLRLLRGGGVNRVSMGAQSFHAAHLRTLERIHTPGRVGRAVADARAAGIERVSIDLIYAVPGQSPQDWRADLERALSLSLDHLSCYNLTYEPNTAMTVRLARGEFVPAPEDDELAMFDLAEELLTAAGLTRYEVSNYARGGIHGPHACRHNLAYWRQGGWLAAGPSASGHLRVRGGAAPSGVRWKNAPRLDTYLSRDDGGLAPVCDLEPPDPARALRERLMTGLRLSEGVDALAAAADAEAAAPGSAARLRHCAQELVSDGLLGVHGQRWALTRRGWPLADFVARRMMSRVGEP